MTMERYKRCQHCQDVYLCLMSGGPGYHTNHNNPRHCKECAEVIHNALSAVPRKFRRFWEETTDVTLDQLLEWEKLNNAEADAKNGMRIRRVSVGLIRLETGKSDERAYVKGRDKFADRYFHYEYWEGEEDEVRIIEELELNVETNETKPWRNYS